MLKLLGCLAVAFFVSISAAVPAKAETRSLKLYFIHTKERAEIVYKRNGRYDQRGLDQINRFLRDWRRNEPAKMDPRLLDLVWSVYKSVGARDYINVVSAYRSPATNKALRSRSSGVAEKSQHTLGKAMDFYIPGVKLSTLRAAAFKAEGGGVGYYPKSGSPFVHLDVGNVRAWPRMSRPELMALFPDGKTIHVPTDGKPLPGFQQALAAYESRKRSGGDIQVASAGNSRSGSGSGRGLLATLFGGGGSDEEEDSSPAMAAAPSRAPTPAAAVPQQPAAQPEPQAETPETIIAALPARSVPLPGVAPRPMLDVGAPASAPLIAGLPAAQVPPAAEPLAPQAEVALNVPLPTTRPDYTPEPTQVASADQPDLPISAIAPERRRAGSDAISDMLAMTANEARADVVINAPVPGLRPSAGGADGNDGRQMASVSPSEEASGDVFVLASLPATDTASSDGFHAAVPAERPTANSTLPVKDGRMMASLSASPRVAVIGRDAGSDAATALESGVRTTAKSGKPRAGEARRDPRSVLVPVEHDLTRWAFNREVTVETAGGTKQPAEAFDMVRTAPQAVYTAGFQQGAPAASADRFSGKAVTFMSVAKFATN